MVDRPNDPKLAGDPLIERVLADIGQIERGAQGFRAAAILSKESLFETLEQGEPERRLICYLARPHGAIDYSDAAPVGSMLDSIGDCENLDLMINSPGGSGEIAEKLVEMCRARCRNEFRVIVPNYAKSAATMIGLGADRIVMSADRSELGPIDPQYSIVIGNQPQTVSGHTFIQAYEAVQEQAAQAATAGEPVVGYLQALSSSTMEPAFLQHCKRGIDFSRDLAKKFLREHQLPAKAKGENPKPKAATIRRRARKVAENLLSENTRFSHGRLIGPEEAAAIGLNVEILDRDDPAWRAIWELYVRAEIFMQTLPEGGVGKLFIDRTSTLPVFY